MVKASHSGENVYLLSEIYTFYKYVTCIYAFYVISILCDSYHYWIKIEHRVQNVSLLLFLAKTKNTDCNFLCDKWEVIQFYLKCHAGNIFIILK